MRDYLETFFRRKWLFFVPFVLVLAAAIVGGIYLSWQYQVEARVWIQQAPVLDQAGQTTSQPQATAAEEYSSLNALLQTDDFLGKVVDSVPRLKADAPAGPARDAAIATLRRNLNAWLTEQKLINFRYRARDPQIAQEVVSNTIDLFIAQRYVDRVQVADTAVSFWQARQTDLQQRLEAASNALAQWESAHPPATRATLPQVDQLAYQRLSNDYDSLYDSLKAANTSLEQARFTRQAAVTQQASTYLIKDPPMVPEGPDLSINRMATIALVGVAVAAGLGFTIIALATWFGSRRVSDERTAIPAWLDRIMSREEQTA